MPVAVIATPGAIDANSFIDVAVFDAYCNDRLNATAGTTASDDDKGRAVIEATRDLNTLPWKGYRSTDTQALSWPRIGVIDTDSQTHSDYPDDVIPKKLQDATAELALQYLKAGSTDIAALDPNTGVIRKKIDVLETEWASPKEQVKGLARFPRVYSLLRGLYDAKSAQIQLVRG